MSKVVSARFYEHLDISVKVQYRDLLLTSEQKSVFFVPLPLATSCLKEDYRVVGSKKAESSGGSRVSSLISSGRCLCSFQFEDYTVVCFCFQEHEKAFLYFIVSKSSHFFPIYDVFDDSFLLGTMFSRCFPIGSCPKLGFGLKHFVVDPSTVVVVIWIDDEILVFKVFHEPSSVTIEKQFSFSFGSSLRDISISGLYDPWFAALCMNGSIYYGKLLDPVSTSKRLRVKGLASSEKTQLLFIHFCCRPFAAVILSGSGKMYLLDILKDTMEQVWALHSLDDGVVDRFISIHRSHLNPFEFYILTRFHIHTFDERQLHHPVMSFAHFLMSFRPFCLDAFPRNSRSELLVVGCEIESYVRLFILTPMYDKRTFPFISEPHCVHVHLQSLFSVPENMTGFELYHSYKVSFPPPPPLSRPPRHRGHAKEDVGSIRDVVFVHCTADEQHPMLLSVRDGILYFCWVTFGDDEDPCSNPMEYHWHPVGSLYTPEEDAITSENMYEQWWLEILQTSIQQCNNVDFFSAISQLFHRIFHPLAMNSPSISSDLIRSHIARVGVHIRVPHVSTELLSDMLEKLPDTVEWNIADFSLSQERFIDKRKHLVGSLLDRGAMDTLKECLDEYIISLQSLETIPLSDTAEHYLVVPKSEQVDEEEESNLFNEDEIQEIVEEVWKSVFT